MNKKAVEKTKKILVSLSSAVMLMAPDLAYGMSSAVCKSANIVINITQPLLFG